ncbi:excisionase family DNA binding protein [Krasilnikovia cinnamomea]|uniref:Excisionase family DNA binding protein n=1 Tax=Krasilnikovia cinnamomea TaxID=349313 RepID=A0A4Q7ZEM0_9ACTN|nr:helix-turn-helix domain-containing protein [Krasilnikovia cinnamomea]RZU48701.1 excisionase family DNA binding protein [Krasilnikovia cinnamomea]
MVQELYSVEQVAERLGLHVRTVRNYVRDGRLKAVRIGKQYRIARADLEALTGGPVLAAPENGPGRARSVEVSSVVDIDAVGRATADRVSNTVMAAAEGARVQTLYDEERAHLKIVIFGEPAATAAMLHILDTLMKADA